MRQEVKRQREVEKEADERGQEVTSHRRRRKRREWAEMEDADKAVESECAERESKDEGNESRNQTK